MKYLNFTTLVALSMVTAGQLHSSFTYEGGLFTEDFNSLPNVTDATETLTGTGVVGFQAGIPSLPNWQVTRLGGSASTDIELWQASSTGGRFYAYGTGESTDRALGHLGSGSAFGAFGVSFINNTTDTFTELQLSVASEIWAVQGTSTSNLYEHRLEFAYGLSSAGITDTDYLTNASMTLNSALDVVSEEANTITGTTSGTNPDRDRDGNSEAWRDVLSTTVTGISWAPGETLFLRWTGANGGGFDAGLAIDDFSLTAVPEPSTTVLFMGLSVVFVMLLRRRRR